MSNTLQENDVVFVTPMFPRADGRGLGVVRHVGPSATLADIIFMDQPQGVVCLVRDCVVVDVTAENADAVRQLRELKAMKVRKSPTGRRSNPTLQNIPVKKHG